MDKMNKAKKTLEDSTRDFKEFCEESAKELQGKTALELLDARIKELTDFLEDRPFKRLDMCNLSLWLDFSENPTHLYSMFPETRGKPKEAEERFLAWNNKMNECHKLYQELSEIRAEYKADPESVDIVYEMLKRGM